MTVVIMTIAVFGRFVIRPRFHGRTAQRLVNFTLALCAITVVATAVVFATILS